MAGRVRVDVDFYRNRIDEMFQGDEARAFVAHAARVAADEARDIAPENTGDTKENIQAFGTDIVDGVATSYYGSSSPVWHIVEFGSVNNPPYRPLTTAAENVGLDFQPE